MRKIIKSKYRYPVGRKAFKKSGKKLKRKKVQLVMKRRIASVLVVGLILGVIGFGSCLGASKSSVKFTLWHSYVGADQRAEFMERAMADFRKSNPDIEVVEEKIPRDQYQTKLKTVAAAGQLPDAFILWPNSMTQEFAKAKLIDNINDLLKKNPTWRKSLIPRALDEFTVDGKTYSAGLGLSVCSLVFYNKALFEKYNLTYPKTYKQFLQVVKVFKKNGVIPIALGNKPKWPVQSSIFSLLANRETGSAWLTNVLAKKNAKFTDPKFIEALNKLKELTDIGAFNKDYNSIDNVQMRDYFYRGEAAMMIDGSWALQDIANKASADLKKNIVIGVFPKVEGGKGDQTAISGVSATGVVINAKASPKQKAAIKKLIMALTNEKAQLMYADYYIPVSSRTVHVNPAKVDPVYGQLVTIIKQHPMVTVYDSALNSEMTEIINNGLQAVMLGTLKPIDLAKQLQAAVH